MYFVDYVLVSSFCLFNKFSVDLIYWILILWRNFRFPKPWGNLSSSTQFLSTQSSLLPWGPGLTHNLRAQKTPTWWAEACLGQAVKNSKPFWVLFYHFEIVLSWKDKIPTSWLCIPRGWVHLAWAHTDAPGSNPSISKCSTNMASIKKK